ncbi:hypothetical protein [Acidovorax sp. Leaf160]|uniref:hypothetical protein n=1 Tax=Acidovorax sp. Leaf160 TaxID=1736280 RepID=UPI0006F41FD5|nr:hypothetical protein [Acidovorax sp. Leaf160]KQR63021.1 hypothetical protein ASF94_00240 [Acidovorax sp. Leaf160]
MRFAPHPRHCARAPHRRERGLGLLETMLLLLVVTGALVAGAIAIKTRQASLAAEDEMAALTQADRFLASFVAAHNRLPCPATGDDGVEDCGSGAQKGKLPYRTLGLEGSMAAAGVGQLGYEVQRSAVDLAKAASGNNDFEPIDFGGETYNARRALSNSGTTADFCQTLASASSAAVQPNHARVGSLTDGYPVAYALAHPGRKDADGDGRLLDGLNASATTAMERPDAGSLLSSYDDRVVARTYSGLAQMLDCERLMASLNIMSLATEVVEEVDSQRASALATAAVITTVNGVKAIVSGVKIAVAAGDMGTASGYMATASGLLATAIATCVFLVGCAEIPHAAASVAAAGVAIGAAAVAIALNAAALASSLVAFGIGVAATVQAGQAQTVTIDISASVTAAKTTWDKATATRVKAQTDLTTAQGQLGTAVSERDAANAALYTEAHNVITEANDKGSPNKGTTSTTAYDGDLAAVKDKADAWILALQNFNKAADALKQAQETAAGTNTTNTQNDAAIAALQKQIDDETDPAKKAELQKALDNLRAQSNTGNNAAQIQRLSGQIAGLSNDIANLNAQINAETDPTARADLVNRRDTLLSQRDSLNAQLASLSLTVASAQATKDAAQTALNDAQTALDTAKNSAADKFQALPYVVKECTTQVIDKKDVTTCRDVTYYFNGRQRVLDKLNALYDLRSGKYLVWWTRNENVKSAQQLYDNAVGQEASAKTQYERLAAMSTGGSSGAALPNEVWKGAATILQQVDRRGGIR